MMRYHFKFCNYSTPENAQSTVGFYKEFNSMVELLIWLRTIVTDPGPPFVLIEPEGDKLLVLSRDYLDHCMILIKAAEQ